MTILTAIKKGFGQTWQYKRMVLLLYLMTFLLAAFVAYPLKNLLESTVGHSMMISDLVKGFDYTFLNDFNNAYGAGFLPIMDQSLAVLGLFLLLLIFFTGGIVATFLKAPVGYDKSIFWGQGAHFFWRILRLTGYFFVVHLLIFVIFGCIFYQSVHGLSPFELENEGTISFAFKIIAPTYICVAAFFFMWHDYTKVILVESDKTWVFQSLWKALKFIRQNFRHVYGLYLLNLLLWGLIIFINIWISTKIIINSSSTIFISFSISQLFVIIRLYLKLVNLSSVGMMLKRR